MRPRMVAYFTAAVACLTFVLTSGYANMAQAAEGNGAVQDLAAAARSAKGHFRPLGLADVGAAKAELLDSVGRLEKRLAQAGDNGQQWAKYLQLSQLQAQLQRPEGADMALLGRILARYDAGHDGLELVWFLDVRRALHNYLATASAVGNQAIGRVYDEKLDKLATDLDAYKSKPTTEGALKISEAVRWLEDAHQRRDCWRPYRRNWCRRTLLHKSRPRCWPPLPPDRWTIVASSAIASWALPSKQPRIPRARPRLNCPRTPILA